MTILGERADTLARWGAPPLVQAMSQWLRLQDGGQPGERALGVWLDVAAAASAAQPSPFVAMPEVDRLLQLRRQVPPSLRLPHQTAPAAGPAGPLVKRTYEATTPVLSGRAAFIEAARKADDRAQWGAAAPQMTVFKPPPLLAPDGCLWRGRLEKCTDLLKPICGPLKTRETIEILAQGQNNARGGGTRRYEHRLVSCVTGPGLTELLEDSGWIELHGTASAVQLRIHKRVTVRLPLVLEQQFGGILQAALAALLWFWAEGFLRSVALPEPSAQTSPRPAPSVRGRPLKDVPLHPDGAGGFKAHVAVLGGGPAGLACAWLLARPQDSQGKAAWDPPSGKRLSLDISVVEKNAFLGGKAASNRQALAGDTRIHEHGLHVLMGCYDNLLNILGQLGVASHLVPRRITRVPLRPESGPTPGLDLELGPWPQRGGREPLADWLVQKRAVPLDLSFLGSLDIRALWSDRPDPVVETASTFDTELRRLGYSKQQPSPWLRAVLGLWNHLDAIQPLRDTETLDAATLQRAGLRTVLDRLAGNALLALSRQEFGAGGGEPPEGLAALAGQLRLLARAALPLDSPDPQVRLAGEAVELAATIALGLAEDGHFAGWTLDGPNQALGHGYTAWARQVHELDAEPLDQWLLRHGTVRGFPGDSRLLAAVTAGLFTTPADIAAGTFIHGLLRLLLTYGEAPYFMLPGGTDAAVVSPIVEALRNAGVALHTDSEVADFRMGRDGSITAINFKQMTPQGIADLSVDAVVLAIPPFERALEDMHLPEDLTLPLRGIESRATVSIQHWTTEPPKFAHALVSGLQPPMRCAAAMDHLAGDEGADVPCAPVYYCGELDEAEVQEWQDNRDAKVRAWLVANAGSFQDGEALEGTYSVVHAHGSARYVSANCSTQDARPELDRTEVPNLWLAGDWTRTTLACGSIEAAVTSGLEAARMLLWQMGCQVHLPIVGAYYDKEPT